jgi:hypothetical protein
MISVSEVGTDENGKYTITDFFRFSPYGIEEGKMSGSYDTIVRKVSERLAEKAAMAGLEGETFETYLTNGDFL